MVPTPLWFLITKIVKLKFRSPGLWLTWQELATLFGYSLGMVWVLAYAVNPVTVPLSPAPAPIGVDGASMVWDSPSTPDQDAAALRARHATHAQRRPDGSRHSASLHARWVTALATCKDSRAPRRCSAHARTDGDERTLARRSSSTPRRRISPPPRWATSPSP